MAFDGVLLNGIMDELEKYLLNGRVDKIYQPEKDEIHLIIRNGRSNYRLLVSASANYPRIHLTNATKPNPPAPPMFCMVARKYLDGSRLVSIEQPGFERILVLSFEALNEFGEKAIRRLYVEIMGRHSNIVLTDDNSKILDSIKHVGNSISRVREVLPGKEYLFPPTQGKLSPLSANPQAILSALESADSGNRAANALMNSFTGISKATAEEIVYTAFEGAIPGSLSENDVLRIAASFECFFARVKSKGFIPCILLSGDSSLVDILPFKYSRFSKYNVREYDSFSEALDDFYLKKDTADRIQQRTSFLHKTIRNNLERCEKKLALHHKELEDAQAGDTYRLYGELITANIHNILPGSKEVSLPNYYDPDNAPVTIPLDPDKSPSQNAQVYFRLFAKSKTIKEKVASLIQDTRTEIEYLESLSESLSRAENEAEIQEIADELAREGYIKSRSVKKPDKHKHAVKPHRFVSSDGFEILVGRNNTQNDMLTFKLSSNNDIWLHSKAVPGSHVIIKAAGKSMPETTLIEAAILAAYHSKAKFSENVPVDYCPAKNVKKPSGAKPGMVIYSNYKTLYVTPSEEVVNKLKI